MMTLLMYNGLEKATALKAFVEKKDVFCYQDWLQAYPITSRGIKSVPVGDAPWKLKMSRQVPD